MSFSPTGNPETPVKMLLMVDVHFYLPRHEVGVADHILMLGTASYGVWYCSGICHLSANFELLQYFYTV